MRRVLFALTSSFVVAACHGQRAIDPNPPAWLDAKADERGRAAAPGAERLGEPLRGVAYRDDDRQTWEMPLDVQHCYAFSGLGEATIAKFSLYLFDQKNHKVADAKTGTEASLLNFCPKEPGMYRLEGKVGQGYGHFSVIGFRSDAAPPPVTPTPAPEAEILDLDALIDQQAASAAPGAHRVGDPFVGKGDLSEWYAPMKPGFCYWVVAAGEPKKVKRLSMYLWDPGNHRVTESRAETNLSMVGHCPTAGGMFKFEAKIESGSGHYKAALFERAK